MAIKYTEEQLNSVDKSMLIQMFLSKGQILTPHAKYSAAHLRRLANNTQPEESFDHGYNDSLTLFHRHFRRYG